ncbi:lysophospholipid acyltransferase family protein [Geobacter sp. AOG1]|uniref:lysophospholipid acyltransferase family protein n=1 Tax=Geobacter sp. AOG1 TaxID=1566346 RepID=UPI001CC5190C|nr:lysophospholipid acyltransferase family protein [Geobacter sp. AOG1]GFE58789.1 lipid A biosynthesis acyltransferase [Geobacter sp. AOG1]
MKEHHVMDIEQIHITTDATSVVDTECCTRFMKQLKWRVGMGIFIVVSLPVVLLPRRVAVKLGELTGILLFHLFRRERVRSIENIRESLSFFERRGGLDPAHGSPYAIARRTFAHYGKSMVEVLKLYYGVGQGIIDSVEIRGLEHYRKACERDKGVVFITGHCGNWELMALAFGARHAPVSVVAKRQGNQFFNSAVERLRSNFRNGVIYADGAARKVFYELRGKGVVGILLDKVVKPQEGALVDFLGRPAWTPTMPAIIAEKTGVPLVPIFIHREGNGHVITISPEVQLPTDDTGKADPVAVTQELTGHIENHIRMHPHEWMWMYKRWKNV